MKRRFEDFHKTKKYIEALDAAYQQDKLSKTEILKMQSRLDQLADKYQENNEIGSDRYLLYQLQAMIFLAKEKFEDARGFLRDAESLKGDDDFDSEMISAYQNGVIGLDDNEILDAYLGRETTKETSKSNNHKKINNTKTISGWLALFGLMVIVSPFINAYYSITNMGLVLDSNTDVLPSIAVYVAMVSLGGIIIAQLFFVYWFWFFRKKKSARAFGIFIVSFLVLLLLFEIVAGIIVFSRLGMLSDFTPGIAESIPGLAVSVAWLFYLIKSQRVKQTFVN
ncbi:MAG: DUF2569 family protein [Candidatus Saccharibacteria bacterium]|nr:DUF2569 family protein [Candidatus Saccharibacteria bacterium]